MKVFVVGGDFSDTPRESGLVKKFVSAMNVDVTLKNGGKYEELAELDFSSYDVVFWMPNIDNSLVKIVNDIKIKYPKIILIQSKFNNGKYVLTDLVARALKSKSNLLIEFSGSSPYFMRLIDPLANIFIETSDVESFVRVMMNRVEELLNFSRMSSISVFSKTDVPDEAEFFKIVESYGQKFHELIHAINQERYLGNCSFRTFDFRCSFGFPSFKDASHIFVSRRNLDKRNISKESFVPVRLGEGIVEYSGEVKPSVDTPIQLCLYELLPNIKYMLHAHVYIDNAPYTSKIVPCGALEEVGEIMNLIEDKDTSLMFINLKGHGSIAMASNFEDLKNIPYIVRYS